MQAATTDPPFVPIRKRGWPTRRSPAWTYGVAGALVLAGVAVGLSHHPTSGERATDLRTLLTTLTTDVESCSGGVGDALRVLAAIQHGTSHDAGTAISLARQGAANCSPANNELLDDLTNVQVPESLARYHLQAAVTDLIDWAAPDAAQVQSDVAAVLTDRGQPAENTALARLGQDLRALRAQRAVVDAALAPAIKALSPGSAPPKLWVTARPPNSY